MASRSQSALLNRTISSLFNGVSQQPASLRLPSQAEAQVNCYPALVEGLKKRAPTEHVAKLNTTTTTARYVHFINRDAVERYVVVIENGDLKVYDLAGNAMTVNFPAGKTYLNASAPEDDFVCLTIADYTFIVNKTKTVAMGAGTVGGTYKGVKQTFSALPGAPAANDVWKIEGDNNNKFDNYYVIWDGSVWLECAKPGQTYQFDATTMPHKLVRTGAGTFEFNTISWDSRGVGDTTLVPNPSFVGQKINDIFLHRNRLGVLSNENLIMTAAGDYFNFWRETMITIVDSDPIDTAASNTKVATLKHAIPFDKTLLLFSDQTQFILAGSTVLTPSTATIDVATEFSIQTLAKPVAAGPNVFFAVPKGDYSGIREYFVDSDVATNDAADITSHVPSYVPTNVFQLVSANNEDVLFALTRNARNKVYVYKYYWQADEKVQSAWGVWEFDADDVILGMTAIDTDLYFVIKRADGTYLETLSLQVGETDTGMGFKVLLDRRTSLTGVYDAGNNWTTWTLPYEEDGTIQVILGPDWTNQVGAKLFNTTRPSNSTIRVTGDYSAHACYVGLKYTTTYTFSEQFMRDEQRNAIRAGRLMMKYLLINFTETGYFKVQVTPQYRDTYTYTYTGKVLGAGGLTLGSLSINDGNFRVPLMADSRDLTISLVNDSHLPSVFQSAEWEALFHVKSQR